MSLNLTIVVGSHRRESNSAKVADLFQEINRETLFFDKVNILDLGKDPLPFWGEELSEDASWVQRWQKLSHTLKQSDAYIMISPEWAGMATPAIKNFFLLCGISELGDKPAIPVGVSMSRGGAYPITELRASSYKNNRLLWLNENLIFRNVSTVLSSQDSEEKSYMIDRSKYSIKILASYAKALKNVRQSGVFDYKTYPNGM